MSAITIEAIESFETVEAVEETSKSTFPDWFPAAIVLVAVIIGAVWFGVVHYQFHLQSEQVEQHANQMLADFIAQNPNTNLKP